MGDLIALNQLRVDGGTQPRAQLDLATVAEYAAALRDGMVFPEVVVFHDGADHWLADGFHRLAAVRQVRGAVALIDCDVRPGTLRDAILFSAGANAEHGLRRTNEDKRRAVRRLLEDDEWGVWSDREIARRCNVGPDLVGAVRLTVGADSERRYTTRHGTTATMDTSRIGRPDPLLTEDAKVLPTGPLAIERLADRTVIDRAVEIRRDLEDERRRERIEKLTRIEGGNAPLVVTATRYHVVYADPAWQYDHPISGSREIENHYPTMTIEEICALPVRDIAAGDAVLAMWTTSPHLRNAFDVIDAWGFEYRTSMVWTKDRLGMGMYVRQRHEHLLIAVRGALPVPAPECRPDSVIEAPRGVHSAKPECVYGLLELMYPEPLRRVELFARAPREGWAAWGNQAQGTP